MRLSLTSAPAGNPVSLTEAKAHLRISNTASDTLLGNLLTLATQHYDGRNGVLRRALVTQSWRMTLDNWPACRAFELPLPPLQSVESIQYYDADNALQTFASSNYVVITDDLFGRVELTPAASWPVAYDRDDAVQINFTAGYGAYNADPAAVPEGIRQAILLYVAELFAARGDESPASPSEAARARLVAPYLIREFA